MSILNKTFNTASKEETQALAISLSKSFRPGDIVFLCGELGSGKTTFVQGLARGLGINRAVRSPSFIVANEYTSKKAKLYHIDLYRLASKDIGLFGLEDYLYCDAVCAVEWAEKIEKSVKPDYRIEFKWVDENKRKIVIKKRRKKPAPKG